MEVHAHRQRLDDGGDPGDEARHLPGTRHPDGIGNADFHRAGRRGNPRHLHHPGGIHFAVEGTAEGRRDGDLRAARMRPRQTHHLDAHGERRLGGLALIARGEAVGCRAHRAQLFHARFDGAQRAALVQYQSDENHPFAAGQPGRHGLRVGHLRHQLRVHEAVRLEPAHAGSECAVDQFQLLRGREQHRLVLQAVASSDFNHFY